MQTAIETFELKLTQSDNGAVITLADARLVMTADQGATLLRIEAGDAGRLASIRETVSYIVGELQLPVPLEWAADRTEARPANLTIARIAANDRISPSFQRLRLTGDFRAFEGGGFHFRLIFGPKGVDWPSADATGKVVWPGGIDAWHRPPYTIRAIDPGCRWIDVDIFLHDGGRVTDWVSRARPGDEVALTGPGGKAPQAAGWIGYVGDETALPVIARALQTLPEDTRGEVCLFIADEHDRQALKHPAGVNLRWLVHGRDGICRTR